MVPLAATDVKAKGAIGIGILHRHECGVESTAKANKEASADEALNAAEKVRRAHQGCAENGDGIVQKEATFSGREKQTIIQQSRTSRDRGIYLPQ